MPRRLQAIWGSVLEYSVVDKSDDSVVVALSGHLVGGEWTRQLQRFLEEHYVNDGVRRIRLDVERLQDLDEDGLATLLQLRSDCQRRGKALLVDGASGRVRQKLVVVGLLAKLQQGA